MHRSIGAIALACAIVLCGCSPKDTAKTDSTKVAQTGAAAGASTMYDPATHTATVTAREFAYAGPDSVPAGWTTFHLVNDGTMFHHLAIVRIDSGKTFADFQAVMKKPALPAWVVEVGGPNVPDPKTSSNATINLQPGLYVMLCFVDMPDNVPHMMKGMVRPLTVTASAAAASTEPTADATITLADYNFTMPGTLNAGHHIIKVANGGPQSHEVQIVRLAPGKTMRDLGAYFAKPEGPPPANALGGVAGIIKGDHVYFDVDLTPGNYALICFIPDKKDQKPHLDHGMVKEFKVN